MDVTLEGFGVVRYEYHCLVLNSHLTAMPMSYLGEILLI